MAVSNSILEAVKMGLWEFLPHTVDFSELEAPDSIPGTREKLEVLAEHLRSDVPVRLLDDDCLGDDYLGRRGLADYGPRRRPLPR
jgi:hypothetical protein